MPHSVWRRVRARVHLSLAPVELANPVRSATKKAFSSLLMRYSPALGGAVVAHIGPVELCGPPIFVDASPFAHVAAIATLLVFAPTKGTELLGVVTHVGPDHLGLSVLSAFHAVLPIDGLTDIYHFESRYTNSASTPTWKRIDGTDHITAGRQIRFAVSELKPTRTGLFQIIASLDPTIRQKAEESHPLGLLPSAKEISLSSDSLQQERDNIESRHADVLQVPKRTSVGGANGSLEGDELLTAGNDTLGDALMPTTTPVSMLKQKKRRHLETEPWSVNFEDSRTKIRQAHGQDKQLSLSLEKPLTKAVPSPPIGSEDNDIDQNRINASENAGISDRKKRKMDKKKKKKKKKKKMSSREEEQPTESQATARGDRQSCSESAAVNEAMTISGKERGEIDSGILHTMKQEQRTADDGLRMLDELTFTADQESTPVRSSALTSNTQDGKEEKEQSREKRHRSGKKEGKKGKKRRRTSGKEENGQNATDLIASKDETNMGKEGKISKKREKRKTKKEATASNWKDGYRRESGKESDGTTAMIKMDAKNTSKGELDARREISMRIDAENAVELGPMKGRVEDEKGLVQTQADLTDENATGDGKDTEERRKKKKRRRRSSEGGMDEEESKKRKKKKKRRMSDAVIEIERRRSLQR